MDVKKWLSAWSAFGMLAGPLPVRAYEMGQEEMLFGNLPVVYAASKKQETLLDAPATTIVISDKMIAERGYRNLKDVLQDLPGMEVVPHYHAEMGTLVPVRGVVGNNKITLLVNGARVNPPGGEYLGIRDNQSVRYAKRVEIVYGPGSSLYGADAVSAVVNIVTKTAEDEVGNVNVSYGMMNTAEASVGVSRKLSETASVTAYAQSYDSDETKLNTRYPDWFANRQARWEAAGRPEGKPFYRWNRGQNAFIELKAGDSSYQYWFRRSDQQSSTAFFTDLVFSDQAIWRDDTHAFRAQTKTDLTPNLDMTTAFNYVYHEIEPQSRFVFPGGSGYYYQDEKYGRGDSAELESLFHWTQSSNLDLIFGLSAAKFIIQPKATVATGFDPKLDVVSQSGTFQYWDTVADRDAQNPATVHEVPQITQVQYQRYAAFFNTKMTPSEKLDVVLGARLDGDSRYKAIVNPRGALIYKLGDGMSLKYVYGQAYVVVPPYFEFETHENPVALNVPNHKLKPEKATSNEVNLSIVKERMTGSVGLYYNQQKDLFLSGISQETVVQDPIFTLQYSTSTLVQNKNLGKSTIYGVDGYVNYRVGEKSSVFGAASWVKAEFDIAGAKTGLDLISSANLRVGGTFYPSAKLYLSPRASWRSNPHTRDGARPEDAFYDTNTNSVTFGRPDQDGRLFKSLYQIDLYSGYHLTAAQEVFLRLTNLTDNKYGLRGVGVGATAPAEGFRAEMGYSLNFGPAR